MYSPAGFEPVSPFLSEITVWYGVLLTVLPEWWFLLQNKTHIGTLPESTFTLFERLIVRRPVDVKQGVYPNIIIHKITLEVVGNKIIDSLENIICNASQE